MSKITELTAELARPVVEACGCTLWDVEYIKEAGSWYLRLYIDKEGGVSIDDCEAVSRGQPYAATSFFKSIKIVFPVSFFAVGICPCFSFYLCMR